MPPYITETPFDQNDYLNAKEEGVCNALVLEWLVGKGAKMTDMRRTITRARKTHKKGVSMQTFNDWGLLLFDTESSDGVTTMAGVTAFADTILGLVSTEFLIGGSGIVSGHAIGMIRLSPSNYLGFDPNYGYYVMGNGGEATWLKTKLADGIFLHQQYDLTCWGFI